MLQALRQKGARLPGDPKLAQRLLGHASIQTTGDIYVDYDNVTFAAKMVHVLRQDDA